MLLTLKDVLDIDIFHNSTTVTAKNSLHKRDVESISVIEVLVDNYSRKNEIVLSTAISCGHDPDLFYEFVKGVIKSEAASLVVAIGHYVIEIPEKVKFLAEKHEFPIILMPWKFRFSDIIHAVLSGIYNRQRINIKQSQELQEELLKLFLSKADLSTAAETIYRKIGQPIIIVDKDGNWQGKSSHSESLLNFGRVNTQNICWEPIELTNITTQTDIRFVQWEKEILIQLLISSANNTQGYLLLSLPQDTSLEEFFTNDKNLLLEHAATSIALWFQRESTIKETEIRLRDDFVWSLTKCNTESWEILTSRAKLLGFEIDRPYVCIIGLPENLENVYETAGPVQLSYEYWMQNTLRQIEEKIIQVGRLSTKEIMTTYQKNKFILFLETSDTKNNNAINSFLGLLEQKMLEIFPGIMMSLGIGENHDGMNKFQKSYNDAKLALEIGIRQKGPGHRNTHVSTGTYRILQSLSNNDDVKEVLLSIIGKLVKYDKDKGSELTQTLIVYIRNHSNVSQTARELFLHRHSLLYRLGKIESLTELSLSDPDNVFLLNLCLHLWAMGYYE